MNANKDSGAVAELPLPSPPARYLQQRALTTQLAAAHNMTEEVVAQALARLRFLPRQYDRATHALRIPCREFDGSLHREAEQVVLFGNFTDDAGKPVQRLRFSAKGVPNRVSWYGNTESPSVVVYCESRLKALVVAQANPEWLCAGLNGVDGWSAGKDKEERPILAANLVPPIATRGLPAVLLPDSSHHKAVRRAMAALKDALAPHYRSVTLAKLPAPPPDTNRTEWGADDFAAEYGHKALQIVVREDAALAAPAYELLAAPAIAAQQPPPWIARSLIPADELTLIVGPTSCGKTFLTMDLLLAIARRQKQWFGFGLCAGGPVVHVTLEGRSLPRRLLAYRQHHGCDLPADYYAISGNVTLHEDCERLVDAMAALHPTVIAIDTVNRAMGGGDENSSADMGAFVRAAERLRLAFPGCAVLLIHHLGKDETRGARGHSSLKAAVGAELVLTRDEASKITTVKLEKQRDGETGTTFSFALQGVELPADADGPVTGCVVVPAVPPVDAPSDNATRYRALYAWYTGKQNNGRPISKRRVTDNLLNIRPRGARWTKADMEATVEWAADMAYAELAGEQPKVGKRYTLQPMPEAKF